MKILIIGAAGQAGTELQRQAAAKTIDVLGLTRNDLDICDASKIETILKSYRPDWLINFAAFHVLDACEDNFEMALKINAAAVRQLASAAARHGCRFLTVSTDYVFDGSKTEAWLESDNAIPLQAYGISKRAGELAAMATAPSHAYIVRTCGLYGHSGSKDRGGNFIEKRMAEGLNQSKMEIGSDLICTPTSAYAFAAGCLKLMLTPEATPGIYHFTAAGQCSWAEFTAYGLLSACIDCTVIPIDRQGHYGKVRRPAYSVLKNDRAAALGITFPHWHDDLAAYIKRSKTDR